MASNIEFKARVDDFETVYRRVERLAGPRVDVLDQVDTFFFSPRGRLKLRSFDDGKGELIFYQRADSAGPKRSVYHRVEVPAPESLGPLLIEAWGQRAIVRKRRHLFLRGRTRIHVDRVESLGDFLEVEVVLADGDAVETAVREADWILEKVGLTEANLVDVAYVDLLTADAEG